MFLPSTFSLCTLSYLSLSLGVTSINLGWWEKIMSFFTSSEVDERNKFLFFFHFTAFFLFLSLTVATFLWIVSSIFYSLPPISLYPCSASLFRFFFFVYDDTLLGDACSGDLKSVKKLSWCSSSASLSFFQSTISFLLSYILCVPGMKKMGMMDETRRADR